MKRIFSLFLAIICAFAFASTASARLVGDINSDGKANSTDALLILRYSVGLSAEFNEKYADVNSDGKINSGDALVILKIAVGSYDGDLEVDDGELVTSYVSDVVQPIISTKEFTLKTETESEGKPVVATTMVRQDDICVETTAEGRKVRLLVLDSKTYLVIPDVIAAGVGIYMPYEGDIEISMGGHDNLKYIKSENVTVDGEQLVCETYERADGTIANYYFKDGKWVMFSSVADGVTTTQKILDFKKGVDKSKFSLNGLIEVKA